MKIDKILLFFIFLVSFACATPAKTILYIANKQADCVGVGPQKCMLIKYEKEDKYSFFYNQITDFNYEVGYYYKLEVLKETIDNPPADASSIKYTLVKILEKSATPID